MRAPEYTITDENYYEYMPRIGSEVAKRAILGLSQVYTAQYKPVPGPNRLAYNIFSISMFFDTTKNRLFVTYRLDDSRVSSIRTPDRELYNRINDEINMVAKDEDIKVSIIGIPTSKPEYDIARPYGITRQNPQYIRTDTEFMWNFVPGPNETSYRYFVQNEARLKDDIRKLNMHPRTVNEYFTNVNKINKKYIQDRPIPRYDLAFRMYKRFYKYYFGSEPKEVEDWRAFTIYIDITHDVEEEKAQKFIHDEGKIFYFERVEEYIKQWGRDHGKDVPN